MVVDTLNRTLPPIFFLKFFFLLRRDLYTVFFKISPLHIACLHAVPSCSSCGWRNCLLKLMLQSRTHNFALQTILLDTSHARWNWARNETLGVKNMATQRLYLLLCVVGLSHTKEETIRTSTTPQHSPLAPPKPIRQPPLTPPLRCRAHHPQAHQTLACTLDLPVQLLALVGPSHSATVGSVLQDR